MIVGKVVGSVVSTRKSDKLIGQKFMIVEPVHHMKADLSQIVAIYIIGAGIGEYVLVAQGSAARIGCGEETAPMNRDCYWCAPFGTECKALVEPVSRHTPSLLTRRTQFL